MSYTENAVQDFNAVQYASAISTRFFGWFNGLLVAELSRNSILTDANLAFVKCCLLDNNPEQHYDKSVPEIHAFVYEVVDALKIGLSHPQTT